MASKIKVDTLETANGSGSITLNNPIAGFTSTGIDDNATSVAITIDASENVGIGTSSPARELDIVGNANVSGGYYANNASGTTSASSCARKPLTLPPIIQSKLQGLSSLVCAVAPDIGVTFSLRR